MADEKPSNHDAEVKDRKSPSGEVVYETVLAEADEELSRKTSALFWSGLAAGLSMGFSALGVAILKAHLPDTDWAPLIYSFGYSLGFLIAILGRQQLFTENTLTPILPLLRRWNIGTLRNVARLWGIILLSNMLGAFVIALVFSKTSALGVDVRNAMLDFSRQSMQNSFATNLLRAIFSGWLIALIVWMLPFAESARIWIIIFLTYAVSLGHFPHIIAGAVEVFTLALSGQADWSAVIFQFLIPTLLGNILGGVTLVAALNHGQVPKEK